MTPAAPSRSSSGRDRPDEPQRRPSWSAPTRSGSARTPPAPPRPAFYSGYDRRGQHHRHRPAQRRHQPHDHQHDKHAADQDQLGPQPVTSPTYAITAAHTCRRVTVTVASPTSAAGALTTYKVGFTTSVSGGLSGDTGSTITVVLPAGTGLTHLNGARHARHQPGRVLHAPPPAPPRPAFSTAARPSQPARPSPSCSTASPTPRPPARPTPCRSRPARTSPR